MIRRPPRSTPSNSSAASDVYKRQDFNEPGRAFGEDELQAALDRGAIQILDEATIANMKAKRARDRARDEAERQRQAVESGEQTDWQQAMREWEDWEKAQK